jgi:opacity protein-like surface antigen
MKRWALLCGVMFMFGGMFAGVASAQDHPTFEAFGGYSYLRVDENIGLTNNGLNFNGGSGSLSFNPNSWLGIVGDIGAYHWSGGGEFAGSDATAVSYMFGPKIALRHGPITPFVQTLFGGTHISGTSCDFDDGGDLKVHRNGGEEECGSGSDNSFSLTLGGGVDWNATRHLGIRLIQAEYYMTRFFNETQNNARISVGVVVRF